jgi:hypothetical protein
MVLRQIKEKEWEDVYENILNRGKAIPLSKQYDLTLTCNGTPFILRVQLETKRRILVLQALEVCGYTGNAESDYVLISDNAFLLSLINIYLYQIKN